MPIQSIEPRRLYRQIADQIRNLVQSGEFPLGQRLPAERDLAQQFGVSRPSVREALIALEVEGLVEVRGGSGVYVVRREAAANERRVETAYGPFEIIRARQLIEGELAAAAAQAATPALLDSLRASVREMEADISRGQPPVQGDRQFHLRLAQASDNTPLVHMVGQLFDERGNPLFAQLGLHFETEPTWRAAVTEHRAVMDAIAERQPEAARRAMHLHLQSSGERFAAPWSGAAET